MGKKHSRVSNGRRKGRPPATPTRNTPRGISPLPARRYRIAVGVEAEDRARAERTGRRLDVIGRGGRERGRRRLARMVEVQDAVALGGDRQLGFVRGEL